MDSVHNAILVCFPRGKLVSHIGDLIPQDLGLALIQCHLVLEKHHFLISVLHLMDVAGQHPNDKQTKPSERVIFDTHFLLQIDFFGRNFLHCSTESNSQSSLLIIAITFATDRFANEIAIIQLDLHNSFAALWDHCLLKQLDARKDNHPSLLDNPLVANEHPAP
jgi:hypothetical protein